MKPKFKLTESIALAAQSSLIIKRSLSFAFTYIIISCYSVNTNAQNTKLGTDALANNVSGNLNTALGFNSMFNNTSGSNNMASGHRSLFSNKDGHSNTALGMQSMYSNKSGSFNTAIGYEALYFNIGSFNTALGYKSLISNITGAENTANGYKSLASNKSGISNTANGSNSLSKNTAGSNNSANGANALFANTTGSSNTANGKSALFSNTTGYNNVAVGQSALFNSTLGHNLVAVGDSALFNQSIGYILRDVDSGIPRDTAYENTAIGSKALFSNSSGYSNTATGFKALYLNKTGSGNIAIGNYALEKNNTSNYNTGIGYSALANNTGSNNTATGAFALLQNVSGKQNSAFGYSALFSNSAGSYNTAIGYNTLPLITTQIRNTAIGWSAGAYHTSSSSTFLGHKASSAVDNVSNSMALGFLASVTASYQVRVGSSTITSIGGFADWTDLPSDGRFKQNVKENVPGLNFIKLLRPVTYTIDVTAVNKKLGMQADDIEQRSVEAKSKELHTGFIAQEVETVAKKLNYDFNGVDAPKNASDMYGIRYAKFVVPLVKAVQELDSTNKIKDERIIKLESGLSELRQIVMDLKKGNSNNGNNGSRSSGYLLQNNPNPFSSSSIIRYYIPENASFAKLLITNQKGQTLRIISINNGGKGEVTINSDTLASGTYNYSLWVDGKQVDTKRLVLIK